MERLGIRTTTTPLPILTTDASALRTVAKNIDLNNIDKGDWLAFETAAGGRQVEDTCSDDGCQARCNRLGCESMCKGDTCAAGVSLNISKLFKINVLVDHAARL
ncbi:uncharacterized protein LOC123703681 [Colias croceus]|uniref:uncharacterized protein LOC123703681 n=1 Tax=Colias crocea TaxID=72248 RepID=UPI001E279F27|nr:uncharacterized protein LOC123703681 [Colias croceus]